MKISKNTCLLIENERHPLVGPDVFTPRKVSISLLRDKIFNVDSFYQFLESDYRLAPQKQTKSFL